MSNHRGTVLVADDNPVNQLIVGRHLAKLGYQMHTAANGQEAVQAAQESAYDLILMDCLMPKMDGFEATRKIRASEGDGDRRVPIIAFTASVHPADSGRCLEVGMDDFLTKPVKLQVLATKLERWLRPHPDEGADLELGAVTASGALA